ncbi:GDP-mannose 4,6-dehydratase [Candidatus Pelagibacter sp.]|nr:GDP-mannose 4,6-dehydratase [Candidatus Pelagibacter sp.]
MKKKILITGVCGFIGYSLAEKLLLKKNFIVVGIDSINNYYEPRLKKDRLKNLKTKFKKNFIFYKCNIENKKDIKNIFQKHKFKATINLAAQAGVRYSLENPEAYIQSNLVGFFNILNFSKIHKVSHFLYASTSSVYGFNKKLPFSEKDNVDHPIQLYAATKRSNELLAHSYSHLFGLPTTGLRFFTVYGPWGRPDMALFKFTKNMLENKKIDIFNFGKHTRDFTYIDDITKHIIKLINNAPKKNNFKKLYPNSSNSPFRVVNIGNSKQQKLMDFIKELEDVLKIKSKKNFKNLQKGDVKDTLSDTKFLQKLNGKNKPYSTKKGISKFVDWYKNYYNK